MSRRRPRRSRWRSSTRILRDTLTRVHCRRNRVSPRQGRLVVQCRPGSNLPEARLFAFMTKPRAGRRDSYRDSAAVHGQYSLAMAQQRSHARGIPDTQHGARLVSRWTSPIVPISGSVWSTACGLEPTVDHDDSPFKYRVRVASTAQAIGTDYSRLTTNSASSSRPSGVTMGG